MSVQSIQAANEFSTTEHDFRLEESFTILLGEWAITLYVTIPSLNTTLSEVWVYQMKT